MWSTLADSGVIDHIKMHETGKITLRWTPPWGDGEMSGNPPYFIGAVAWTRKDPQTSPWAQWDNNVAMRAVQPIVVPPHKEYRYKFDFKIGNPDEKRTGKLAFWLNRDILPPGWVIRFTKKEGAFYTFRPGYYEVVTMYVIPPSSAIPGECARLEISEVLELKGDDGRGVKMGQGMTVESTVSNLTIDGKQVELINAVINPDTLKILGVAINWSANEEIADYWYEIYSPDGKSITGPKIYFENIKFRPNETKRYLFRHPLPEYLAPGLYSYRGKIGKFPDYTSDDVYLNFFVSK
jgi:hypothetical protein